jgi:hypothetical protein
VWKKDVPVHPAASEVNSSSRHGDGSSPQGPQERSGSHGRARAVTMMTCGRQLALACSGACCPSPIAAALAAVGAARRRCRMDRHRLDLGGPDRPSLKVGTRPGKSARSDNPSIGRVRPQDRPNTSRPATATALDRR